MSCTPMYTEWIKWEHRRLVAKRQKGKPLPFPQPALTHNPRQFKMGTRIPMATNKSATHRDFIRGNTGLEQWFGSWWRAKPCHSAVCAWGEHFHWYWGCSGCSLLPLRSVEQHQNKHCPSSSSSRPGAGQCRVGDLTGSPGQPEPPMPHRDNSIQNSHSQARQHLSCSAKAKRKKQTKKKANKNPSCLTSQARRATELLSNSSLLP